MAKQAATAMEPMHYGVATHVGGRPNLEDRAHAATVSTAGGLTLTLAMVADGIGGNVQGERAAELAIETAFREVQLSTATSAAQLPLVLAQALQRANTAVFEEGRADRSRRGMGSTAVLAAIHDNQLYLANIGDSRAYLVRDGHAAQITRDHTWAFEMHRQRLLTEAEIAKHPKRHELVRSIGYGSSVDVDLGLYLADLMQDEREAAQNQGIQLAANDRLVLCSDGLIKEQRDGAGPFVPGEEMARIVGQKAAPAAAEALVQRAVSRHADDNVSAVVLEMPGSKHAAGLPPALLFGLAGLVLLLGVGALAFFLLRGGEAEEQPVVAATAPAGETVVATDGLAPSPTLPAAVAGQVQVVSAAGGSWRVGETTGALAGGSPIDLPQGQPVTIASEGGVAQLLLPGGGRVFLEAGSAIEVTAGNDTAADFKLNSGRALVHSGAAPVAAGSFIDARATLVGPGLMGLHLDPASLLFEAACLQGECDVAGSADGAPLRLPAGQATLVGNLDTAGPAEPADFAAYFPLAPDLVPQPTATPSPTPTLTPTLRPTNRPAATPTLTPSRTPAPLLPTDTPAPPGGGDDNDNDNLAPTKQPTEVPPPPTERPTDVPTRES